MIEHKMKVLDECGTVRHVTSIASNRDHVGNRIAEGDLQESERVNELIRLYEGQLRAKTLECQKWQERCAVLTERLAVNEKA